MKAREFITEIEDTVPQRNGPSIRAMRELQRLAQQDNITLMPEPRRHGKNCSVGFKGRRGSKTRSWQPLNELFERPYPVKIFADQAVAKDDKGRPLYIVFDRTPIWETVKITFDRGQDFSLTDWRDEFRIFATVIEAIRQWSAQHRPGSMYFSVPRDEPNNRMRLYQRMVDRLSADTEYQQVTDPSEVNEEDIAFFINILFKKHDSDHRWWLVRKDLIRS
jgi:uncharacterized protein (DUF736 family)